VILPALTAIVDADVTAAHGWTVPDAARACLNGGAGLLQVRAKHAPSGALLAWCDEIVAAAAPFGAAVVVNDRADIARMSGAGGVHVGQDDLPPTVARRLLGPAALVGCSTHTPAQLTAALSAPIDYVAYGPVFATATKTHPDPVVGLDGLRGAARQAAAAGVPLVAIGGITLATAPAVLDAGASAVAVIGDLLAGHEPPVARARRFLVALGADGV
jgi:thiamine-phosphate pyrophosphorylase